MVRLVRVTVVAGVVVAEVPELVVAMAEDAHPEEDADDEEDDDHHQKAAPDPLLAVELEAHGWAVAPPPPPPLFSSSSPPNPK